MAHSESIIRHLDRQNDNLQSTLDLLSAAKPRVQSSRWDAREILLHLLGATSHFTGALRESSGAIGSLQRGGDYLDRADLPTAADVAHALLAVLRDIRSAVGALDDRALERTVAISQGDAGGTVNAPLGLVVRQGLTEHFDEHVAQLREALAAD
jgi:hypothetical protein